MKLHDLERELIIPFEDDDEDYIDELRVPLADLLKTRLDRLPENTIMDMAIKLMSASRELDKPKASETLQQQKRPSRHRRPTRPQVTSKKAFRISR